tara:strand:- start:226 stop:405 length:180 start_codon:yes stop_codon:yes gene_type:complete
MKINILLPYEEKFVEEKRKINSIVIILSVWEELLGLVAAEAISSGTCIIFLKLEAYQKS